MKHGRWAFIRHAAKFRRTRSGQTVGDAHPVANKMARLPVAVKMTAGKTWLALAFLTLTGPVLAGEPVAILQGLDKVTARVSTIEAPLNRLVPFGTLEIIVRSCHKTPPEEPPESAAFIEIRDVKPGEAAVFLFGGWMFASSPGLSALEHPVYDVWVLDCAEAPEAAEGLGDDPDEPPSSSGE